MDEGHVGRINGYTVIYTGIKTKSETDGYYYEHDSVAEKSLGRKLRDDEVVHHLDLDRANNHPGNLLVLTKGAHSRLHAWIRNGCFMLYPPIPRASPTKHPVVHKCSACDKSIYQGIYCSPECAHKKQRVADRPTKEQLLGEIKIFSWEALGLKYKVSSTAVRKWAKAYGLPHSKREIKIMK